jgi:hypothetical protein
MSSQSPETIAPTSDRAVGASASSQPGATLAEALLAHRPRETSGASSANRFGYQRTWALCHLLQLHEQPGDYVLILEFHDDILVLDNATDPKAADFYQVKTRNGGQWSRSDLTRVREKSAKKPKKNPRKPKAAAQQELPTPEPPEAPAPRSILGKLIEHSHTFSSSVRSLNLVSNACFKIALSSAPTSAERDAFSLDAATPTELAEFEKALNAELQVQGSFPWPNVHCRCTPISLTDHETHAAGVLAGFLERRQPGGRFAVQPLYRAIAGEFARRATNEWQPSSFAELCEKKGLRRADLEEYLRHAIERPDPEEQLKAVVATLAAEGVSYRDVTALQEGWRSYDIGLTDMTDVFLQELRSRLRAIAEEVAESPAWKTLSEFMQAGQALYRSRHGALVAPLTTAIVQGALLRELKNYEARKSAPANSQPQEKAP